VARVRCAIMKLRRSVNVFIAVMLGITLWAAQVTFADDGDASGDWAAHWQRGLLAAKNQDYDTAAKEISKSIELAGPRESKEQFISRGDAYFGQGAYEGAIADYTHAIQLSKRNAVEITGSDQGSRTFDLAPIYRKLAAAYNALAGKSEEVK
jgi:tetratricopeptide (TPR) repeat protein